MPESISRYCISAVKWADSEGWSPFAWGGRVVVMDTKTMAQDFLPLLGGGRRYQWSEDGETITFTPMLADWYNRAAIITGYDPYDVPNGSHERGTLSEAKSREWRHHIMWHEVYRAIQETARRRYAPIAQREDELLYARTMGEALAGV